MNKTTTTTSKPAPLESLYWGAIQRAAKDLAREVYLVDDLSLVEQYIERVRRLHRYINKRRDREWDRRRWAARGGK